MAESQDATLLQRRARRRLVGAIALVVLIVIVLPIVLDREAGPIGQDLVIQIPSQEAGKFNTRVLPPAAPGAATAPVAGGEGAKADAAKAEAPKPAAVAAPVKAEQPAAPAEAKAPAAPEPGAKLTVPPAKDQKNSSDGKDAARALALLEGKQDWVVPLGTFSNQDNAKKLQAKLTSLGITAYAESVKDDKGERTRVRAGPFDSKPAAEKAREKLSVLGLHPAAVVAR